MPTQSLSADVKQTLISAIHDLVAELAKGRTDRLSSSISAVYKLAHECSIAVTREYDIPGGSIKFPQGAYRVEHEMRSGEYAGEDYIINGQRVRSVWTSGVAAPSDNPLTSDLNQIMKLCTMARFGSEDDNVTSARLIALADGLSPTAEQLLTSELVSAAPQNPSVDDADSSKPEDQTANDDQPAPLGKSAKLILRTMREFDPMDLRSVKQIVESMDPQQQISERTAEPEIKYLIQLEYVQRPLGERGGARLTTRGRMIAAKFAD